jgi:hypothetical protein
MVREATGSPVSMYERTIELRISALRAVIDVRLGIMTTANALGLFP